MDALELRGASWIINFVESVERISRAVTVIYASPTFAVAGDAEREGNALGIIISPRISQIVCRVKDVRLSQTGISIIAPSRKILIVTFDK